MPSNVGAEMIGHALVADGMACNGKEQIGNGPQQDRSKSSGSLPQICKKAGDLKKQSEITNVSNVPDFMALSK